MNEFFDSNIQYNISSTTLYPVEKYNYSFSSTIRNIHLNAGKIVHGGYLATIADTGMGTAAHKVAGDRRCVTINLDIKFISAGMLDDNLTGIVRVLKKTKTLIFINCEIVNDKGPVVFASGTWKIL